MVRGEQSQSSWSGQREVLRILKMDTTYDKSVVRLKRLDSGAELYEMSSSFLKRCVGVERYVPIVEHEKIEAVKYNKSLSGVLLGFHPGSHRFRRKPEMCSRGDKES